jgi:alpha-mannosidase
MHSSDTLPGEWLIRRLLHAPDFSLPQFPGYVTSLPQLLQSCGQAVLSLPAATPLPSPALRWRGIDGTEVGVQTQATSEPQRWDGELPLSAQTAMSPAAMERALRGAELFAALAQVQLGAPYPQAELTRLWETVSEEARAQVLQDAALAALTQSIATPTDAVIVFNPTDTLRPGDAFLVRLPGDLVRKGRVLFTASDGEPLSSQFLRMVGKEREYVVTLLDVEPLGYQTIGLSRTDAPADESTVTAEENVLENDFVRVTLNAHGELSSLVHKTEDGEREALAAPVRSFGPDAEVTRFEVLENGPVRASLLVERQLAGTTLTQRIQLWAHSARVEFVTELSSDAPPLTVSVPAAVLASRATYGIPFGALERPTYQNTPTHSCEAVTTPWTDLSEGDFGVSLLATCPQAMQVRDNTLSLTLTHSTTYAILPHTGDWRSETVDEAHALRYPLLARFAPKNPKAALPASYDFVSVDDQGLIIETIKRSETDDNALVVRLYEALQTRGEATLTFGFKLAAAYETNSLEQDPVPVPFKNNTLTFPYRPFEIKTFVVHPQ